MLEAYSKTKNVQNSALSLETRTPQIKLFAARKTEIGRLVPVEGDFSPAVAMSLNK